MQTILGANGTIASVLAKELPKYTSKIRLVSRNPRRVKESDELFPADLSDPSLVDKAVEGSQVVYLLVGFEYKISVWQKNWPALMKATIDACEKHKAKLVFFDNVYMYHPSSIRKLTEECKYDPQTLKGKVRSEIAQMILNAIEEKRLDAIIARAADFYGPKNDRSFLCETVFKPMLKKKSVAWIGKSNKKHSFTFTPDAAKAVALLANTPDCYNQTWHLPTATNPPTGKEFVALFSKEAGLAKPASFFALQSWLVYTLGFFDPFMKELNEMMYQYNDDYVFECEKFTSRFPDFAVTGYEQGVRETVAAGL